MKKPSTKSKVVEPPGPFHPKLPRFDVLMASKNTDHELLARLIEMRSAWAAMDRIRGAVFGQIGEDIERFHDQEPDVGKSQGKAEHSKDNATTVQPRAQRGRGRPKDRNRLLNDMIILKEFECLTKLSNKKLSNKKRISRKVALAEMKVMRGIPKSTLYKKLDRIRRLGKTKKV